MSLLKVEDMHVYYGNIHAIKGVSFEVNEGEIVTLIGANGAGKSTTLNTVAGLLKPRAGQVTFNGQNIVGMPASKVVSLGMALCPEGRRVFQQMTVRENLEMGGFTRPPGNWPARWTTCTSSSRASRSAKSRSPARFPAANSRCWPWAAP